MKPKEQLIKNREHYLKDIKVEHALFCPELISHPLILADNLYQYSHQNQLLLGKLREE